MNDTLAETIDHLLEIAVENILRDSELQPVGFFVAGNEVCGVVPLPFDNAETKRAAVTMLGVIADKDSTINAVIILSDVWMSISNKEAEAYPIPSEDPARKEAIVLSCKERDGSESGAVIPYERNAEGKIVSFGERKDFGKGNAYFGLLENVFARHHSTH